MRHDRRRAVLAATALGALSLARAFGQPVPKRVITIGVLANEAWPPIDAFREGMRELGYVDGRNVRYAYRYAEGRNERFRAFAEELVAQKVDLILTWGTEPSLEAKRATKTIPIVMGAVGDPLAPGIVANLARPGGNITGFSTLAAELEAKRLELLTEIVPKLQRVGVIGNPTNRYTPGALHGARQAAKRLKLVLIVRDVHDADSLDRALDAVGRERAQALLVLTDPFFVSQRRQLADFAIKARLPSAYTYREYADAGGLVAYTPSYKDLFHRAAGYADRILRGANPGDLPIEQASKFELIVNLRTAKAIGIKLPQSFLQRADEVIR